MSDDQFLLDLPADWQVRRIKTVGRAIIGLTYSPEDVVDEGDGRLVLRAGNIQEGHISLEDNVYVSRKVPSDLRLRLGDIIICARNGSASLIGKNASATKEVVGETWGAFMVVLRTDINDFLRWVLNSELFRTQAGLFSTSTISQLTSRTLHDLKFALPPLVEQRAISAYLEDQTSRIDKMIAEQRGLIESLRERRAALVSQLLASSSGSLLKLSWLFSFHNGDRGANYPSREEFVSDGIPFINAGHLNEGRISFSKMNFITPEKFANMGGAKLVKGDILFCLRGSLGKTGIFEEEGTGALASSLVAMRPVADNLDRRYFSYVLGSQEVRRKIDDAQTGSAQPNLSVEQLRGFRVDVPDYLSQVTIRTKLDDQTSRIDELIAESQDLIALSQERRAALITAAVTGKIDVRTAA